MISIYMQPLKYNVSKSSCMRSRKCAWTVNDCQSIQNAVHAKIFVMWRWHMCMWMQFYARCAFYGIFN